MKSPADRGPASSNGLLHHRHCDKCKDQRNMIKRQECNEMNHPQSWWLWGREWLKHRQRNKWKVLRLSASDKTILQLVPKNIALGDPDILMKGNWRRNALKCRCWEKIGIFIGRQYSTAAVKRSHGKHEKKQKIDGGCHFSEANVIFCRKKRLKSLYF